MSDDDQDRCTGRTAGGKPCRRRPMPGTTRCWSHSFKVPGRPSKLTLDLQEVILYTVLEGNYIETAVQAAGVNKTTLYRWLRRGEEAEAKALEQVDTDLDLAGLYEHADPEDWPYLDFRHALKSAEAYAETELLRKTLSTGLGWQAFMTVLERRHPNRWGRRERITHEGAVEVGRPRLVAPESQERRVEVAKILQTAGVLTGVAVEAKAKQAAKRKPPTKPKPKRRGGAK